MHDAEETGATPRGDEPDALHYQPTHTRRELSPAGQALANYLEVINASGEEAEDLYREGVRALRERPEDVVMEIARLESCWRWDDYSTRWGLIYAAVELGHASALPFFRSVVLTPIPPERSSDPHAFSSVAEETILRTTAVDGVARLAAAGNKLAVETLFEFLDVPSMSIKRAAVQALISGKGAEGHRGRLEERLCPEDRFLLDIRPGDVRRVQQIRNPEEDLSEEGRADAKPATPDLPDRAGRAASASRGESPKTGGGDRSEEDC